MRGEESLVSIRNLYKSFGKQEVLKNVNFDLQTGEVIGFVGPSGSGKSVFLKILLGFLKPTRVSSMKKNKNLTMGFSLQHDPLYDYLTVEQNLQYFSKLNNIPRKDRSIRIQHLIQELDILNYKKTLVKNLSGGTKKRVDLACSLIEDPEVLILDEPFLGLDPKLVSQLSDFIRRLQQSGVTVIISSHRIEELSKICTRFIELREKTIFSTNKYYRLRN